MKLSTIYIVALESFLTGILISMLMAYVALGHNPQHEFYNDGVVLENLLPMMASWLVVCGAAYAVLRFLITFLVMKVTR